MYGLMLLKVTAAPEDCFVSRAHCWTAPSIWRRLLMQAFCWEVVRAFTKFGIAIAASKPMMATTIMISTRVKPDFFEVLIFIQLFDYFLFCARGERCGRRVTYKCNLRSRIACCARAHGNSKADANRPGSLGHPVHGQEPRVGQCEQKARSLRFGR